MVQNAIAEYFGSVEDGLVLVAELPAGYWARKTRLPEKLTDIAEYRSKHQLPEKLQQLCNAANRAWNYGEDKFWEK